jgi:hypothetical protein
LVSDVVAVIPETMALIGIGVLFSIIGVINARKYDVR